MAQEREQVPRLSFAYEQKDSLRSPAAEPADTEPTGQIGGETRSFACLPSMKLKEIQLLADIGDKGDKGDIGTTAGLAMVWNRTAGSDAVLVRLSKTDAQADLGGNNGGGLGTHGLARATVGAMQSVYGRVRFGRFFSTDAANLSAV